ncbi:MgtC/SapB family protein [Tepidibacillus infernus]|uniref:MgtC/SapB family protein n=1 Tax=Tepidibacillus infernus TaxID=1806172 RepID=UPI003A495733
MAEVWSIDYLHILLRLSLAVLLGGVIGFEREQHNHPAGFRTHILVSLGSTLIMLISIYGFEPFLHEENVRFDPSRIAAQVVAGIGFLGAGTILRHGFTVTGLTTAASLWVVAAIGLGIGAGFYFGAVVTTFFVLVSLAVLAKFDQFIIRKRHLTQIRVCVVDQPGKLGEIAMKLGERKINVKSVSIHDEEKDENEVSYVTIDLTLRMQKPNSLPFVVDDIKQIKGVKEVQYGNSLES